jgi:hypothetical protein
MYLRHICKEKHRKGQYDAKPNNINVSCVRNKFGIEYELIFNFCILIYYVELIHDFVWGRMQVIAIGGSSPHKKN